MRSFQILCNQAPMQLLKQHQLQYQYMQPTPATQQIQYDQAAVQLHAHWLRLAV